MSEAKSESGTWMGIQSGDVGFDQGGGLVGFLIRHFSHSPYAHCWVYHHQDESLRWVTAEAYPGGLRLRTRENANVHRVVRAWRTEDERMSILARSGALIGLGYNYRELFRIIHHRLRQTFIYHMAVLLLLTVLYGRYQSTLALVAWFALMPLTLYAAIPLRSKLNPSRVICSNHVAQSVLAARPDIKLTYPPQSIWPGRLERDLNVMTWNDWTQGADHE